MLETQICPLSHVFHDITHLCDMTILSQMLFVHGGGINRALASSFFFFNKRKIIVIYMPIVKS